MKIPRKLAKQFKGPIANGWYILRTSSHLVWANSKGDGRVTTASTPSDINAYKQALRQFRKQDLLNNRPVTY